MDNISKAWSRRTRITRTIAASLAVTVGTLAAAVTAVRAINDMPVSRISPQAAFTSGNLVVYRVGTGAAALSANAAEVFLDEYTTSGTLVQSIALPTAASGSNKPLTANGGAVSEGQLTRSVDGKYLVLTGYAAAPGTASISSTTASAVPRVVGRVDSNGTVDTTTALTDTADSGNVRSAASTDGTKFWVTGSTGGLRYATLGSTASTQISTTLTNLRVVQIYGGQLYISAGSASTARISAVGSGTPSTPGQAINTIPGYPTGGSPYGFVFVDRSDAVAGLDTLYVGDAGLGIQKYSFDGTTWTARGAISAAGVVYGLTGFVNANGAALFGTAVGQSGTNIISLTDTAAFDATITGTPAIVATAGTNRAFRGIAFAPQGAIATPTFTPTTTSTATPTGSATATSTFTPTATGTAPIRPDTPGLYNPANAFFLLRNFNSSGSPTYSFPYGPVNNPNLVPLIGDWNGDKIDTVGLYNRTNSAWLLSDNNVSVTYSFPYGSAGGGLVPVVGDWDNNGTDTPGLFNPANGAWLLINQNAPSLPQITFLYGQGTSGLLPIVGDWDGDGDDTQGLYNPANSAWILANALNGAPFASFPYGNSTLKPVKGDYDANGTDTPGMWNPANGAWLLINVNASVAPQVTYIYGAGTPSLIPLMGKWPPGGTGGANSLYRATPTASAADSTATIAPQVAPTFAQ